MANMLHQSHLWLFYVSTLYAHVSAMDSGTYGFAAVGGLGTAAALYCLAQFNFRDFLDYSKPGALWRVLTLLLALINLKSLPFAWHYRLLNGLLSHVTLGRRRPISPGPSALFQPIIIKSRTSLWETDYNLHKSNSTYFSDLDIARMHLITCLMKTGLHKAHYERPTPESEAKYGKSAGGGRLGVMLGGVACNFRREIRPYEPYEIWTRILTWDRKWLYLVSHVVRKGAVKPAGYSQQPWRKTQLRGGGASSLETEADAANSANLHPAIFATSLAKYVFKSGRITIPPEVVLTHGELLPPKLDALEPLELGTDPGRETIQLADGLSGGAALGKTSLNGQEAAKGLKGKEAIADWSWERIEAERARGMDIAQHYGALDQLHAEFTAGTGFALGEY